MIYITDREPRAIRDPKKKIIKKLVPSSPRQPLCQELAFYTIDINY